MVFDDAVVDDGDLTGDVGVSVRLAGTAMRGPAGVADAGRSGEGTLPLQRRVEVGQLADRADDFHAASGVDGEAGRVVATVLEPAKALHEDGGAVLRSHVRDDSAHATEG